MIISPELETRNINWQLARSSGGRLEERRQILYFLVIFIFTRTLSTLSLATGARVLSTQSLFQSDIWLVIKCLIFVYRKLWKFIKIKIGNLFDAVFAILTGICTQGCSDSEGGGIIPGNWGRSEINCIRNVIYTSVYILPGITS